MQKLINGNVSFVPENFMCTGCGTCVAVCPHDVINMYIDEKRGTYQSNVNLETCTNCAICLKSCPPLTWSNEPKTEQYDKRVGDYHESFACYSTDYDIRFNAASGGFITSLLKYLLENKIIDGAIVTKRSEKNPLISIPFIATTVEEIIEAKGSKYSPVTFDNIIREIMDSEKYSSLAVVGLPCHIEGISRAEKRKKLKNKIKYKISLVCGQSPSFLSYEYSFKRMDIKPDEVTGLQNRGGGWPGHMQVKSKDRNIKIPYGSKYSMRMVLSSPLFTPLACHMCADAVGFNADVSVSDAWLEKYIGDDRGINIILVKSKNVLQLIKDMEKNGALSLFASDVDEFIEANKSVINNKIYNNPCRLKYFLGKEESNFSGMMVRQNRSLSFIKCVKLYIFTAHLKFIRKINIKKILPYLNDFILFYFKVLTIFKR